MQSVGVSKGKRGMVVAGHPAAAAAAWQMLSAGGSAADAAIAGAAALAVVLPQACTLCGDAFALVHDAASGRTHGLNASGPSPALATPEIFAQGIPPRGALASTVPGVVGGWHTLHRRFGAQPWTALFGAAIRLSKEGFPVSKGLARSTEVHAAVLDADAPSGRLFRPGGKPLSQGSILKQPELAATLELLASRGASAFYDGPVAASLARTCERAGGLLRASDFAGYSAEWVEPIGVDYRSHQVMVLPPNSLGVYLLLQLLALEDRPLAHLDPMAPERFVALVRAARASFALGNRTVADPRANPDPVAPLLGDAGRARMRSSIAGASLPNQGGTALISVIDDRGNAVTLVQSIFFVFGSGLCDPDTGLVFNDRMVGFTTERGHPNEVGPRKRPAHTLCPVMVFAGERLRFALGTPGGPGQTITMSQILQSLLDRKLDLPAAIAAPRWSMDFGAAAMVEDTMPAAAIEGARKLGTLFEKSPPDAPFFGSVEAIERLEDGTLVGAADFRRDSACCGE